MPYRDAPAKVNLGLHVLRRRPDGFHDLATVFLPIGWADRLAAEPGDGITLTTSDPALPTDDANLVVRAARALRQWAGDDSLGAALHLDKRVPYGTGLGGGSSDAAATLRLLTDLWGLDVPDADLGALALGLGSDVPFFLDGVAAHATGRGERLVPLVTAAGRPYRCPFWLVVAVPDVHVSTAQAFRRVTPSDTGRLPLADAVLSDDLRQWRRITNDFQEPVAQAYPEVQATLDAMERAGADHQLLSGSGGAVVGVFEREPSAGALAALGE